MSINTKRELRYLAQSTRLLKVYLNEISSLSFSMLELKRMGRNLEIRFGEEKDKLNF